MNHTCKQMRRAGLDLSELRSVQHVEGIPGFVFLLFLLKLGQNYTFSIFLSSVKNDGKRLIYFIHLTLKSLRYNYGEPTTH